MRAIADAAGVNVALPTHYFGGKKQLFAATLDLPEALRDQLAESLVGSAEGAAERLTRIYLGLWEDPSTRQQLLATVRSSLAGAEALEKMSGLLTGAVHVASGLDSAREEGLSLALSHLLGTAIARHIAAVGPVAGMSFDDLVTRVTPAVQVHLS